ncbi:MAG: hypothetical protein H0U14_09375, partial [Thermoleophilaceae bacterium]|nr:hypothetical protein [Thermoleophilaceae bacterium]
MTATTDTDGAPPTEMFGIDVETTPPAELLRRILDYAEGTERRRVSYVNAHVLNQAQSNPELHSAL